MFGWFKKKPFVKKTEDEIMKMSVNEYNKYLIALREHELSEMLHIIDMLIDTMCKDYIIRCKKMNIPIDGKFYICPNEYGITEDFIAKFNKYDKTRVIRDYYLIPVPYCEFVDNRILVKIPKYGARIL